MIFYISLTDPELSWKIKSININAIPFIYWYNWKTAETNALKKKSALWASLCGGLNPPTPFATT